jgi:hypothetical protein
MLVELDFCPELLRVYNVLIFGFGPYPISRSSSNLALLADHHRCFDFGTCQRLFAPAGIESLKASISVRQTVIDLDFPRSYK